MSKKIILLALLMLFTASDFASGKARRKRVPSQKPKMELNLREVIDEIDNYDFLYNESGDNLNYDALTINSIMDEAMSHIGARYRSGSKGPNAFDCSGFTSYVFRNSGFGRDSVNATV